MPLTEIEGQIDRRILINYRIDAAIVAGLLPPPFRPQLVAGHAIGGVCLIRFRQLRPRGLPAAFGLGSENAAYRFAVEWDTAEGRQTGVYIPCRDSDSRINASLGGRLFPGRLRHARFAGCEVEGRYALSITAKDGGMQVEFAGRVAEDLPPDSVFASLDAASAFFARGSLGYSDARRPGHYEGLELRARDWSVRPLQPDCLDLGYFDDPQRFPLGSIAFDSALLMRGIAHRWVAREGLCA